jgi:hypothetical protein
LSRCASAKNYFTPKDTCSPKLYGIRIRPTKADRRSSTVVLAASVEMTIHVIQIKLSLAKPGPGALSCSLAL